VQSGNSWSYRVRLILDLERVMGDQFTQTNRRQFFRGAGVAAGVGTLAGLEFDLKPVQAAATKLKIKGAREVPSICPYCAVGCAQIVSVRQGEIVNIEGHPDSPINRGTLCPKGSAAFQLAVNPNRLTKVKYRAPHATEWEERDLDWAMDRIAQRVKETRDRDFRDSWEGKDRDGKPVHKRVNHCSTIASLGGATMDNEWNYAHLKLWRALGLIWLENQARI
jgi:formate dehydrogenase major subunit